MREHADELYKLVPPDEGKKYSSRAAWHGHEVNKYSFRIGSALKKLEITIMRNAKAKPTPEHKRDKDTKRPSDWGGRGDTWTDRSIPVYDRNGNRVGTFNDPYHGYYENDRR